MIHNQERIVQNIEAKFRSDYPQAATALDRLTRGFNQTPSRCVYYTRTRTEFGEAVDNGSDNGWDIVMDTDDQLEQATDRFYFQKEHDWTWLDVDMRIPDCTLLTGTTPVNAQLSAYLFLTLPGDFATTDALPDISNGLHIIEARLTHRGAYNYSSVSGRNICREFALTDDASASTEVMGRFPKGKYGAEVWVKSEVAGGRTFGVRRVSCLVTEIPPTPLIGDGETTS